MNLLQVNLLIDIGNTFTHVGVCGKSRILHEFRIPTHTRIAASDILKKLNSYKKKIDNAAISSVVPSKDDFWKGFASRNFDIDALMVSGKIPLPIKIKVEQPHSLGADRICNAVAGFYLFKKKNNVVVIDLGTATTYDVILKNGDFIGGIIAPGIGTSAKALHSNTGKLPLLRSKQFTFPRKVVGRNTLEAIQSGLMYSASFSVEGMISQIEKDYHKKFKVVLTGGLSKRVYRKINFKTKLQNNMVLSGLNHILKYNLGL
jgi:type III pantothenate kinase